jgi:hypothetical protein
MVKYLHSRVVAQQWISSSSNDSECLGVLLRRTRGQYITVPSQINPLLLAAVEKVNVEVAFTMRTETTDAVFSTLADFQTDLLLTDGSQLQVINSLDEILIKNVKKFQYAALLRTEKMLLVWHDDLQKILPHAMATEGKLLSLVDQPPLIQSRLLTIPGMGL